MPVHPKPRKIIVIEEEIKMKTLFRGNTMEAFVHQVDELRAKYAEYSFIYKYDVVVDLKPDRWNGRGAEIIVVKVVREETGKEFTERLEKQQRAKDARELREFKKAEQATIEANKQAEKARLKELALYEKLKEKYG